MTATEEDDVLHIAEIPYPSGEVRYRYSRVLSPDRSRWIRQGLFVEYHQNGQVASEGTYLNGHESGLWRDFYPSGQLASEGHYVDGEEQGWWRFWHPDGHEEAPVYYEHGVEVSAPPTQP